MEHVCVGIYMYTDIRVSNTGIGSEPAWLIETQIKVERDREEEGADGEIE